MVHCCVVTTHRDSIDATEDCVAGRSSGNSHEARIIIDWINQIRNDVDSVTTGYSYGAAPGHQERQGSSIILWCTRCKIDEHHKDNCSTLMNYVAVGAVNPINTQGIP